MSKQFVRSRRPDTQRRAALRAGIVCGLCRPAWALPRRARPADQFGKDVSTGTLNFGGEIDLGPCQIADVHRGKGSRGSQDQVANRLFVFEASLPALDMRGTVVGERCRRYTGEREEPDGFAVPVMWLLGLLAEIDDGVVTEAYLDGLVIRFGVTIDQQNILGRRGQAARSASADWLPRSPTRRHQWLSRSCGHGDGAAPCARVASRAATASRGSVGRTGARARCR